MPAVDRSQAMVGEAVSLHLDPVMVGRAFYCAVVGALAAVTMFEQRRMTRDPRVAKIVTVAATLSLGFTGICCPALAMQNAIILTLPSDGSLIELALDPLAECLMFGVGIALTGVALEVGTWDSFFATSSEERSTILSLDMKHVSIRDLRRGGTLFVFLKALSSRPKYLLLSGFLLGVSLPLTQCLALLALTPRLPGLHMHTSVDWGLVTASVLTSALAAMCTFWILIRLLQWRHNLESVRLCTTILFGAMVVGMNILSCRSLTFHVIHTPDAASIGKTAGPYTVLTYAVAVSIVWCITVLYTTIYKVRTAFWSANKDVAKAIDLLQQGIISDAELIAMLLPHASEDKKNSLQAQGKRDSTPGSPSASRTSSVRKSIVMSPSRRPSATALASPTLPATRRQSSATLAGSLPRSPNSRPSLVVRTSLPEEPRPQTAPSSSLFRHGSTAKLGTSQRPSLIVTTGVPEETEDPSASGERSYPTATRDSLKLTASPLAAGEALSSPLGPDGKRLPRTLPPLMSKTSGGSSPRSLRSSKISPAGDSRKDPHSESSSSSGGSDQRASDTEKGGQPEPASGPNLV